MHYQLGSENDINPLVYPQNLKMAAPDVFLPNPQKNCDFYVSTHNTLILGGPHQNLKT